MGLQQSTLYYRSHCCRDDDFLKSKIVEFCKAKVRHGRPRVIDHVRKDLGMIVNHKKISRIYRELGLQVGKRSKGRKHRTGVRLVLEKPTRPNQIWAMDFVSDQFMTGRRFRCLTIIDLFTRESLALEVDVSLTGVRVGQVLDRLKMSGRLPEIIISDNGTEFTSRTMDQWSFANKVELKFIQPGKPNQNAYCESFNSRLRDECLNTQWFSNLSEAKTQIESWRKDYNEKRRHSSLNYKTPKQFADEYLLAVA